MLMISSNLGPISHHLATTHPWQTKRTDERTNGRTDGRTERQTIDNCAN